MHVYNEWLDVKESCIGSFKKLRDREIVIILYNYRKNICKEEASERRSTLKGRIANLHHVVSVDIYKGRLYTWDYL